jgi:flagellar basal body-associated protein FliL
MTNHNEKISGNELEDDNLDENAENGNDPSQVSPIETAGKKSLLTKRAVIVITTVCFCITAFISMSAWYVFSKETPRKAAVVEAENKEESLLKMDSFVIPYNKDNFSYISFSVSLCVPEGSLREEMITKKGLIRGKIYELVLTYLDQSGEIPAPEPVKGLIAESINDALSEGEVNELFLTQFLLI